MKKLAAVMLAVVGLTGCVAYPVGGGHAHHRYHDREGDRVANRYDRDRDGDGVRNRHDRRPDNPRRY